MNRMAGYLFTTKPKFGWGAWVWLACRVGSVPRWLQQPLLPVVGGCRGVEQHVVQAGVTEASHITKGCASQLEHKA